MSNRPKIHATNAINSIRQYRCTNAGVSNYIKISTVVDIMALKSLVLRFKLHLNFLLQHYSLNPFHLYRKSVKFCHNRGKIWHALQESNATLRKLRSSLN